MGQVVVRRRHAHRLRRRGTVGNGVAARRVPPRQGPAHDVPGCGGARRGAAPRRRTGLASGAGGRVPGLAGPWRPSVGFARMSGCRRRTTRRTPRFSCSPCSPRRSEPARSSTCTSTALGAAPIDRDEGRSHRCSCRRRAGRAVADRDLGDHRPGRARCARGGRGLGARRGLEGVPRPRGRPLHPADVPPGGGHPGPRGRRDAVVRELRSRCASGRRRGAARRRESRRRAAAERQSARAHGVGRGARVGRQPGAVVARPTARPPCAGSSVGVASGVQSRRDAPVAASWAWRTALRDGCLRRDA
jgi:hypothetical protein